MIADVARAAVDAAVVASDAYAADALDAGDGNAATDADDPLATADFAADETYYDVKEDCRCCCKSSWAAAAAAEILNLHRRDAAAAAAAVATTTAVADAVVGSCCCYCCVRDSGWKWASLDDSPTDARFPRAPADVRARAERASPDVVVETRGTPDVRFRYVRMLDAPARAEKEFPDYEVRFRIACVLKEEEESS